MADDDVQLTDLEVIQRYSLAVRGAAAARAELVATLESDLAWLRGGRRAPAGKTTAAAKTAKPAVKRAPAKRAPVKRTPAKRTPAKG